VPSLLVTNDFPPKHGGIQSYLYDLWKRLPPGETTVLTTPFAGAADWDAQQEFRIERVHQRVLLPSRALTRRIDALAREVHADVIFLDPMFPLGVVGPRLTAAPYVIVAHGGEITGYARTLGTRGLARRVMRGAAAVVAAGSYPAGASELAAGRSLAGAVIPPGVDHDRFHPLDADARAATRRRFGLDPERPLVLGISRLVPRKGFDVVIDAIAAGGPGLEGVQLAIAGAGRDRRRLERRAKGRAQFLGRVSDEDLPALYACADVFAMCCRDRWGGREAEGFGIVFLEAAACGVPAVAGLSGGSHEAVADGETGFVVAPRDVGATRDAIARLVGDRELRVRMGEAARRRAVESFDNDRLVADLALVASGKLSAIGPLCR
jgi:phosphatidylinositol alpha-1,6-mannosyltransferase